MINILEYLSYWGLGLGLFLVGVFLLWRLRVNWSFGVYTVVGFKGVFVRFCFKDFFLESYFLGIY